MEQVGKGNEFLIKIANLNDDSEFNEEIKNEFYRLLKDRITDLSLNTLHGAYFLLEEHPLTNAYSFIKDDYAKPSTLSEYPEEEKMNSGGMTPSRTIFFSL